MALLVLGLILFAGFHLLTSLAPGTCDRWRAQRGENSVKVLVSLGAVAGIALMVFGWRSAEVSYLYQPPLALRAPATLLIALGLWLMVIAQRRSILRRVLRHPQLTGVLLWAVAHLMVNGDNRSLVLFLGLALWCVLEIALINRRDGPYRAPAPPPLSTDLVSAAIAALLFLVLAFAHPWIAGVAILPA
jgi:uncharacterized membrane protein